MTPAPTGLEFFKMSGSGNDFVVVDGRQDGAERVLRPEVVQRLCARRIGVGADGVILLATEADAAFRMIYINADGSRAAMCGNAALCSTRLALETGLAGGAGEFEFMTDSGAVRARTRAGLPEIDLAPIVEVKGDLPLALRSGERRMGFVLAGVPHVIIRVNDISQVDVENRGGALRRDPAFEEGANANFVSPGSREGTWAMRTFERGVEGETLACGTGAVSSALMLALWGESGLETTIETRSGLPLTVRLGRRGDAWLPSLRGEGRIVFRGELMEP